MAVMTTVLKRFTTVGTTKTSRHPSGSLQEPKLVIERVRVPEGNKTVGEYSASVLYAALDADGQVLPSKVAFTVTFRSPVNIGPTETVVADALALFREIVASDNFATSVNSLDYLQTT